MTKTQRSAALLETQSRITLYVDSEFIVNSDYQVVVSTLESKIITTGAQVSTVGLNNNDDIQSTMLVVCQNNQHAELLTEKFNLSEQQVCWLNVSSEQSQKISKSNSLLKSHWFIDWSNEQTLSPILTLLSRQFDTYRAKQHAEQKFALLTDCLGELVITFSPDGRVCELNDELALLMGDESESVIGTDLLSCLNIPSDTAKNRMQSIFSGLERTGAMTRLPPFPIQLESTVVIVDGFVGSLRSHESLLIMRQVATWQSQEWLEQVALHNEPVTLLLINPDDFARFNQQYGREIGDQVLDEIMLSLSDLLRTADFVSRYSGVVFAAHLPETNEQQGQALAARVRQMLVNKRFTKKNLPLDFSFGIATLNSEEQLGEQSPLELFRRANTALQAARSIGGGKLVSWEPQFDANIIANLDRMSGKFSDAPEDDFRLLSLQWDLIRLIGNTHSLQIFSKQICQTLTAGMQCEYAGLYLAKKSGLTVSSCSTAKQNVDVLSIHQWVEKNIQIDNLARFIDEPVKLLSTSQQIILPLCTRNQCLGMLLLRWPINDNEKADKYREQLLQVTPNLAAAIDRIILLENDQRRDEIANKNMGESHELLFESTAMRAVLQQVQLVAPTDASVLIIGESGTGKEIIARQIHNHSLLLEKPFITLDCSTIVEHLIESELFGHRKGAFTGATSDQPGMIAQADGGTLFLDEVGELPLDIQSKLLRFVQEKTYVAVGDQRVRKVDVRLVLATNRNLLDEVAMGRFRSDLYYRINVFTVNLPPLHKRGDDGLLLCRHFLAKFSQQYNKAIVDFTPLAIKSLQAYTWPGNVRELRNVIMRAVILCEQSLVDHIHLNIDDNNHVKSAAEKDNSSTHLIVNEQVATPESDISSLIHKLVEISLVQARLFSVSSWLEVQWLNVCLTKWGSLYQVALQLEQSESTLRRRYAKLKGLEFNVSQLAELADECHEILQTMLTEHIDNTSWPKIESILQRVVMQQEISQQQKAQLLNVTQPTLRKISQQVLA